MTLRQRLMLVVLVVVVPAGIASLVSYRLHVDIRQELSQLSPYSKTSLDPVAVLGRELSFEGAWESDSFLASSIEELPYTGRPRLRGPIESIDLERGRVTMFGRSIRVTEDTELETSDPNRSLESLAPGQRVEINCRIETGGGWMARKIKSSGIIKSNDKIKGPITKVAGADPDLALEIEGLPIRVPSRLSIETPRGPVHRIELTSRIALAIQTCLTGSEQLLKERYRLREALAAADEARAASLRAACAGVEDELVEASEDFIRVVARIRSSAEHEVRELSSAGAVELERELKSEVERFVTPLERNGPELGSKLTRFIALASSDPESAQTFLGESLEPQLRGELLPSIHSYQLEIQEELAEDVHGVAQHSAAATRVTIVATIVGLGLASALGYWVARSIAKPIDELRAAARRIGDGDLSARVASDAAGEIGVLARTFNQMAERLSATTVSVAKLNEVIDSIAGALFLLDPDGRITSANPAAWKLLGYDASRLIGMPFGQVCPDLANALTPDARNGLVASGEHRLRRQDGSSVAVTLSASALGADRATVRGYACLAQDLTSRKELEESLRRSLAEKDLLLREVHHRVKNNLQVISSLLELQSRSVSDPLALSKFQDSQDRIRSMVLIHEQLYRSIDLQSIRMRAYLELLAANLAQSHADRPGRIDVSVDVDDLSLPLDQALTCGLIVNELVTNAFKHAFASDAAGSIRIGCRSGASDAIVLEVTDSGRGLSAVPASDVRTSLGFSLVEALVEQLKGRMHFESRGGASFRVEFPSPSPVLVS